MAASSMTGDFADARPRRGLRLLALAYFVFFAALVLLGIVVALFGNPRAGEPIVRFVLAPRPANVAATPVRPATGTPPANPGVKPVEPMPPPAIVPSQITRQVYAGSA